MGFDFGAALKELFEVDRPALLGTLARGMEVREFLNVEFPRVEMPRADVVMRMADRSILHVEFQSSNDNDIGYRQGNYCLMMTRRYRCRVRQVLIYVGRGRLTMEGLLDAGGTAVRFEVLDIRSLRAEDLCTTGRPADLALAMLARGGAELLPEIVRRAGRLRGAVRERLMAQLLVLSGLRGLPGKVELEMKHMGVVIDVRKNPVLMRYLRDAREEGREEGREQGREAGLVEGRRAMLADQLADLFGPLPGWSSDRIAPASVQQLETWARGLRTADSLEQVIRRR
ncbi:MAG: hypothetical protein R2729_18115 [Bryobacteraceae bacterium]